MPYPAARRWPYDIVAVADSRVMLLNAARVITVCSNSCRFHNLLVRNLFGLLAEKNRILTQKLGHMAQRSTREKLLSYLFEQSRKAGSTSFTIAFNRPAAGGFSGGGPQRHVGGAEQDEARRPAGLPAEPVHAKITGKCIHDFDIFLVYWPES